MANSRGGDDPESTPICRCRVLYLGSAVPHVTKDGLQGIQEPLRELYPEQGALGARGIDSWLSVWSNGLLLENVDENHKKVTRFFPIDSLHYCAAVRYVLVPERAAGVALGGGGGGGTLLSTSSGSGGGPSPRFLPLDSPFARTPNPSHPPLFAAILRRTTGIKVLECHAFICKREMAANALVRCCFHAYADSSYARHIDGSGGGSAYGTLRSTQGGDSAPGGGGGGGGGGGDSWRRSTLSLNHHAGAGGTLTSNASAASALSAATDDVSIYNGDENHKVWVGSGTLEREEVYGGGSSTVRSSRSQRPRQVVAPVNAPPPPPTPKEEKASKKAAAAKERNRRKKLLGGSVDNLMMLNGLSGGGSLLRPHSSMSGAHHHHHQGHQQQQQRFANGGGSLLRHVNGYHHPHAHPHPHAHAHPHHYAPAGPPLVLATLPGRPKQAKAKAGGKVVLAPVPLLAPGRRRQGPLVVPVEEPAYMPSARPMSPVASFQPAHFPHEAYLMQQYATVEHPGRHAKKKAAKHKGGGSLVAPPPAVVPVPVPVPVQPPPPHVLVNGGGASPDEDEIAVLAEESTSPFNTGIYRKKGHLNERAFSYSIRQEHRSRSYGSLANLKFSGPDLKKEREIAQMMQDLELSSGDELERADVPATHQRGSLRTANVRR